MNIIKVLGKLMKTLEMPVVFGSGMTKYWFIVNINKYQWVITGSYKIIDTNTTVIINHLLILTIWLLLLLIPITKVGLHCLFSFISLNYFILYITYHFIFISFINLVYNFCYVFVRNNVLNHGNIDNNVIKRIYKHLI